MAMIQKCKTCGTQDGDVTMLCDEEDEAWCPKCFDDCPCGRGEHGEECPTRVFNTTIKKD